MLAAAPAGAATTASAQSALEASIAVEVRLLQEDTALYGEVRARETAARRAADEVLSRLDAALAGDSASAPGEISRLAQEFAGLEGEAARWSRDADRLRTALIERRRRLAELEKRREAPRLGADVSTDPITGRWTVRILPSGQLADFRLELDISLVTGSYRSATGSHGSLRGTFVGEVLTLERIDTVKGADLIFEGRLDRGRGEVRGTWRSTLLSSGEPAAGNWVAFRQAPPPPGDEN